MIDPQYATSEVHIVGYGVSVELKIAYIERLPTYPKYVGHTTGTRRS